MKSLQKNSKKKHNVKRLELGENGDAFLNKDLIKILRYIKEQTPKLRVALSTNFQNFTKEKAEIILREDLVDSFTCNIDGSDNQNYFEVKKLTLNRTKINLFTFLKLRKELKSKASLRILVLTLNNYIQTIHNNFKFYPTKLKDPKLRKIPDDFKAIKKQISRKLGPKDRIVRSWVFAWAERGKIDPKTLNYKKYVCPNLLRIKREAFIAPDGTWYLCCLDSDNELVIGNVMNQTLDEIFHSEKRKKIIDMLARKEFGKIGGPCKTVNCCYIMHKRPLLSRVARTIFKNEFLLKLATKKSSSIDLET
ncbi:MAG: radical SAM/SPASM domain-containing protein [archaeon]